MDQKVNVKNYPGPLTIKPLWQCGTPRCATRTGATLVCDLFRLLGAVYFM